MAPPQIDLNKKKQPLEDVQSWAKEVGDQKLPPLPYATSVPVETGTKLVGTKRGCGNKRCKMLIIGFVIGAVVVVAVAVGIFMATRYMRRSHWRGHVEDDDGHRGEEKMRTEGSRRLIYIARDQSNYFFRMTAVLDYGTQMAGFKDYNNQRCYLDRLREDYENGCKRWRRFEHEPRRPKSRPMRVVTPAINTEVLRYIGGENIYELCGNVPAYWVFEMHNGDTHDSSEDSSVDSSVDMIYL